MLRSEFRLPLIGWPRRAAAFLLGEGFLGFLAIVAAGLTLFPMLFDVGPTVVASLDTLQWMIIGWFAVEYIVALLSAPSKRQFLADPWRWVDVATILIPLLALLPSVSNLVRSSPILRLVRLARLLSLGVRATGIVVRDQHRQTARTLARGPALITHRWTPSSPQSARTSRDQLVAWLQESAPGWFHVANPSDEDVKVIGAAAALPAGFLETHLFAATHPHVAYAPGCLAVFAWLPHSGSAEGPADRTGMLLVVWRGRVLSFSRAPLEAPGVSGFPAVGGHAAEPVPEHVLTAVLGRIVHENEHLVGALEQELRNLEDVPLRESRPAFFEQTFRLKKQLSAAQWDLWRLKALLNELGGRQPADYVVAEATAAACIRLSATTDYLYETVVNTREDLLAVIDLHLNVVSFDMNRVMRVLAVVSVLGLIPAVIGGLLGMNLVDNPWHFTLPQVSFVVVFAMLLGLYFFFVKGWLR